MGRDIAGPGGADPCGRGGYSRRTETAKSGGSSRRCDRCGGERRPETRCRSTNFSTNAFARIWPATAVGSRSSSSTEDTLKIRYEGACGSCPSSLTGTLMAIENMIKEEIDPEISVVAV